MMSMKRRKPKDWSLPTLSWRGGWPGKWRSPFARGTGGR
ncbi:unnamed protein product [Linum tenue]|nr:unnamed protein product [Linum tenue]CAI0475472.1 unnamed protein product [Linum tenue]